MHNLDFVQLSGNHLLNLLEEEVRLQVLKSLLLSRPLLFPHEEVEAADVWAVWEQLVNEHPPEVAGPASDEDIFACECVQVR